MKKMQTTRIGLTIGLVLVAFFVFTAASAVAQTSVSVQSATGVESDETFTVNVTLSDTPAARVGAYGFNITFDPLVVQVKEVTNMPGFGIPNWNNDTGWVKLGGAVYPGVGDGIFGTITFEAIGADGTSTTLDMAVDDLKDEDGNSISHTVTHGLVTVGEAAPAITVTPAKATLFTGDTIRQFTADVASVTWSCDNTSVGTISSTGLFTRVNAGTATITASKSGYTDGTASVTVIDGTVTDHYDTDGIEGISKEEAIAAVDDYRVTGEINKERAVEVVYEYLFG